MVHACLGRLYSRWLVFVSTPRGDVRHIFSKGWANRHEKINLTQHFER